MIVNYTGIVNRIEAAARSMEPRAVGVCVASLQVPRNRHGDRRAHVAQKYRRGTIEWPVGVRCTARARRSPGRLRCTGCSGS